MNTFETSGGRIAYLDEGSGPAVVLLHGFPLTSHLWRGLVPALAARHRVLAPDLLGLGRSVPASGASLHIRSQADYVAELFAALGIDRVAVVGHSTGGGVAQLLAARHPGVEALVLIDSIAFDRWPTEAIGEIQTAPADQESREAIELVVRTACQLGALSAAVAEDDIEAYLRPWDPPADVGSFFRFARALDGIGLLGLEPEMGSWELPTLILWGEDDPFHPASIGERLNEAIPSSAFGLVPDCGHLLPEEAPETIYPVIAEYLRANYLRIPHGHAADGPVLVPLTIPEDFSLEDDDDDEEPFVAEDQEVGPNA